MTIQHDLTIGPKQERLLGHMRGILQNPLDFFEEAATYGDVVPLRALRRRIFLVSHPDYIKYVLVTNHRNYHKGRALQITREIVGEGPLRLKPNKVRRGPFFLIDIE